MNVQEIVQSADEWMSHLLRGVRNVINHSTQVFEELSAVIHVRYLDRDAFPQLKELLTICGGARVPQVVFFSEDMQEVGRYGDRTLAKYRQMATSLAGSACSTGNLGEAQQHAEVIQGWLNEFERIQLILRTSPRLREKHAD